jgi:type I restriction enzyme R subunit
MKPLTESDIKQIALSYFKHSGYSCIHGTAISPEGEQPERQYSEVILKIAVLLQHKKDKQI